MARCRAPPIASLRLAASCICGAKKEKRAAAVLLGVVHRDVGVAQQGVGIGAVVGEDRDADAGRDVQLAALDVAGAPTRPR